MVSSKLRPGVYAPVIVPFNDDDGQSINLDAFKFNVARLSRAGIFLVISGTLGEAPMLSRQERKLLVETAAQVLKDEKLDESIPIIAGIGAERQQDAIDYANDAKAAGADAVVIMVPSYYTFVYGKNKDVLKTFFTTIADQSPVPLFIYNIPFAAGGVDLDADFIIDLSEHKNIAGVKLTCYNIAKGHRIASHTSTDAYKKRHQLPFLVLPGGSDYLLAGLVARQHGCVGGPANLYPKVCARIFSLGTKFLETGDLKLFNEARELQDLLTNADAIINRVGFLGIKTAMNAHVGPKLGVKNLGGAFRKPIPDPSDAVVHNVAEAEEMRKIFEVEDSL